MDKLLISHQLVKRSLDVFEQENFTYGDAIHHCYNLMLNVIKYSTLKEDEIEKILENFTNTIKKTLSEFKEHERN